MKKLAKIISLLLVVAMSFAIFAACGGDPENPGGTNPGGTNPGGTTGTKVKDNETDRLVLSIGELDGVFNPFFSSSATDGSIISLTQIGMISSDKDGKPAYGEDEPCVVLDYEVSTENKGSSNSKDWRTTYKFVLKNDVKFSNGSPLTIRDVLFNLYVYLDPAYTGSSTVYSTDIVGLDEYRQQNNNVTDDFDDTFFKQGWDRINRLNRRVQKIYDDNKAKVVDDEFVVSELQKVVDSYADKQDSKQWLTLVEDYALAKRLFREELESDYNMAVGTALDTKFDEDRQHLNTDIEAFLWNEGYIYWDEDYLNTDGSKGKLIDSTGGVYENWTTKDEAVNYIYDRYVEYGSATTNMTEITTYWKTSSTLQTEFTAKAKEDYFATLGDGKITNISGITFANETSSVTVNGTTYAPVKYVDNDFSKGVAESNEVLQIVIKGVDPMAIWNFGFTVAPMYYYSDAAHISKFTNFIDTGFGVEFSSIDFMNNVVKAPEKIGLPVGAGPYKATTQTGSGTVTASSFRSNNVCYYERNDYFMFPARIKYLNYQVVDQKMMLQSLTSGDIDFAEPNAEQNNINTLNDKKSDGFEHKTVMTNGYGYIGINAEKVPNIHVRRAIMHAINTKLCLDYYPGYSQRINRPMTKASWAYPWDTDTKTDEDGNILRDGESQYYSYDATGELSRAELRLAGFDWTADGKIVPPNGVETSYTFTIAGDSEDHPAFMAMNNAKEILERLGLKITVQKDINALKKLNTGDLAVWAAAWGSGVDPDMYQVYHIDSQAGSTSNWGYRAIRRDEGQSKYAEEWRIVNELSDKIDLARETTDQQRRTTIYAQCLDLVMELAVELPTYQRSDLFAWNANVIDSSTLTPDSELTSYNGPLARIWEVSFVGND